MRSSRPAAAGCRRAVMPRSTSASGSATRRRTCARTGAGSRPPSAPNSATFVFAGQVHGSRAEVVSAADRGRGSLAAGDAIGPADALVTAEPGIVLAILVADCVPIVLYDPAAHVLACVHAGWRGTVARTCAEPRWRRCARSAAIRADVIAGIGPAVGRACYQVGDEVAGAVRDAFGQRAQAVLRPDATGGPASPGRWLLDLPAANRHALRAAGVPGRPDPPGGHAHRARPGPVLQPPRRASLRAVRAGGQP